MNKSERTKTTLAKSLRKLIKKQPLNKVTVTAIAANCNMNRQTFYYHFHDVSELVGWIYEKEIWAVFGDNLTNGSWRENLLALLKYIEKNRDFISKTIHTVDASCAFHHLRATTDSIVRSQVDSDSDLIKEELTETDKNLIVSFYGFGLAGAIMDWADGTIKESPEEFIDHLGRLVERKR